MEETKPLTQEQMARKGGFARRDALTKQQRQDIARIAGSAPKKARAKKVKPCAANIISTP